MPSSTAGPFGSGHRALNERTALPATSDFGMYPLDTRPMSEYQIVWP